MTWMSDLSVIEWTKPIISELTGTLSISCWIIVFIPQIYEIYKTKSTRGLSLHFLVLWLIGDIFNLLGSLIQGLLLTVILLAAYYTLADLILILQYLCYRQREEQTNNVGIRNLSSSENLVDMEPILLSPTTSHIDELEPLLSDCDPHKKHTKNNLLYNIFAVITVLGAGFLSWYVSFIRESRNGIEKKPISQPPQLTVNIWGQIFGYISAILYLSSRIPQIHLNYKRKSCIGISLLFFLFACLGNILFIISLLVVSMEYQYLIINFSWLLGSSGTLLMDMTIFIQFFLYDDHDSHLRKPNSGYSSTSLNKKLGPSSEVYDEIDDLDDSVV
ncbi:similar to Saccharomyces cerevisiae YBR147W RTC2 Protein of unknown function [Maudiozyma barnettii]|uniref:PQ-loop-domain-containing protein n=1 Tax=Maudiozyma barnettii TaxID=61262 RepID=A0A8H2VDR0_9SACH|nr:cationic amino acid transporter [Kazachstania barnettii]CAB4253610.1 similar to Saccharomyces cerevisiae YBR147W RTC2 Protein of unknown function [Kazachstania barnettii]CAD1781284.1 similar to Saccharomyces cerevisiae YBR147W RTC2 Protein of unknown function [Kazachstania barnettii]